MASVKGTGLEKLAEKLLPLLMVLVAGLVLVTGIRGFRAENPSFPDAIRQLTTPFITEAPDPGIEIRLDDGEILLLKRGTPDYELAAFLDSKSTAMRRFPLQGVSAEDLEVENSEASFELRKVRAILGLHPDAHVEIRGARADRVRNFLAKAGLSRDWITAGADADDADPGNVDAERSEGPLELVVNPAD